MMQGQACGFLSFSFFPCGAVCVSHPGKGFLVEFFLVLFCFLVCFPSPGPRPFYMKFRLLWHSLWHCLSLNSCQGALLAPTARPVIAYRLPSHCPARLRTSPDLSEET